jgi:hypothetical protein
MSCFERVKHRARIKHINITNSLENFIACKVNL